jgi:Tfp pilus assembly protein PilX
MNNNRNERGYVLVIVLMMSLLITTFAIVLIPKAMSTMKQVGKSETSTHSRQMAEMGVEYGNSFLQNIVKQARTEAKSLDPTKDDKNFCEKLTARLNTTPFPLSNPMSSNNNFSFQVRFSSTESRTIVSSNNTSCDGFVSMKIPIVSTGKVEGKGTTELKAYYFVDNKGDVLTTKPGESKIPADPNTLPYEQTHFNEFKLSGNTTSALSRSAKFNNVVTISGNGILTIGGNAWFDNKNNISINFNGNNGIAIVSGNAYFTTPISLGGTGKNFICIKGDAYLYNQTTKKWAWYPDVKEKAACPPENKVVQDNAKYFYDINLWDINRDKLDVVY